MLRHVCSWHRVFKIQVIRHAVLRHHTALEKIMFGVLLIVILIPILLTIFSITATTTTTTTTIIVIIIIIIIIISLWGYVV
jgi:hypothetical protein